MYKSEYVLGCCSDVARRCCSLIVAPHWRVSVPLEWLFGVAGGVIQCWSINIRSRIRRVKCYTYTNTDILYIKHYIGVRRRVISTIAIESEMILVREMLLSLSLKLYDCVTWKCRKINPTNNIEMCGRRGGNCPRRGSLLYDCIVVGFCVRWSLSLCLSVACGRFQSKPIDRYRLTIVGNYANRRRWGELWWLVPPSWPEHVLRFHSNRRSNI